MPKKAIRKKKIHQNINEQNIDIFACLFFRNCIRNIIFAVYCYQYEFLISN